VFGGLVAVVALAVIVVFFLASRGESTDEHDLSLSGRAGAVRQVQARGLAAGTVKGSPTGKGTTLMDISLGGPPARILKGPTPFSARFTARFTEGSIIGVLQGTATPVINGAPATKGTIQITGGTGEFEGAEGSADYADAGASPLETEDTITIAGRIEY
jgi:hypothetical protein